MQNSNSSSIQPSPEGILKIGMGFWASKVLLTAVQLQLFTILAKEGKQSASQLYARFQFKCSTRNCFDFLDTLVSLGFLHRDGLLSTAQYSNGPDVEVFLDKNKPSYIGGILEMANNRLYKFWGDLEDGLRTGKAQNEMKHGGNDLFAEIYKEPKRLAEFVHGMSGIQMGNFMAFPQKFDFSNYKTLTDVGGAGAMLSIMVAKHQPNMACTSFDLPPVEPIAQANINQFQLCAKVKTKSGDFFNDELPKADVVEMGNILHYWNEEKKLVLMKKAYDALPSGGAFVAIENVIDDERKQNTFGMLMSLNMLIETEEGFDYTFADFNGWAKKAGFTKTALIPLTGPTSAAVAYK